MSACCILQQILINQIHGDHKPRKPVHLGTMKRNAVEFTTGIFIHDDLVDSFNEQWQKKYSLPPEISHILKKEEISYHCTKVLHQCKERKVVEGGGVGGRCMVWFGRKLFGTEEKVQCLLDIHYQTECELLPNAGTT